MKWFLIALRHYADFSGRATQKEFWYFVLFNLIFFWAWTFLIVFVISMGSRGNIEKSLPFIYLNYFNVMMLPGLAVAVRRLHDTGKSGWMLFVGLIPLIGGFWLLVLMLTPGQKYDNRYGQDPKTSAATFTDKAKLRSAGTVLTVAASLSIINFIASPFLHSFGHFLNLGTIIFVFDIMLLAAGILLLNGTAAREIKGKTKLAMQLLLAAATLFLLSNVINILVGSLINPASWTITVLSILSVALFAAFNLYVPQNTSLIRGAAVAVIALAALKFLWFSYSWSNMYIDNWQTTIYIFNQLMPVAFIVLAWTFMPKNGLPPEQAGAAEKPKNQGHSYAKEQKQPETPPVPNSAPKEVPPAQTSQDSLENISVSNKIFVEACRDTDKSAQIHKSSNLLFGKCGKVLLSGGDFSALSPDETELIKALGQDLSDMHGRDAMQGFFNNIMTRYPMLGVQFSKLWTGIGNW